LLSLDADDWLGAASHSPWSASNERVVWILLAQKKNIIQSVVSAECILHL
jgi:hypothetical protein